MQRRPPEMPPIDVDPDYISRLPEEAQSPRRPWIWRFMVEAIETIVLAVVLFLIINTISARIRVEGQSMEPTFHNGNFVIVNKLSYRFGEFNRGDVIVFPSPDNNGEDLIKRVIALAGDQVRITDGKVYVNNYLLTEPYIKAPIKSDRAEVVVPAGAVFVMGDNRNNSSDSRNWGPLNIEHVLGKAIFVYWPFGDFGLVQQYNFIFGETQA